ncbi:GNAT family N-acetyltransferase [Clostridium sp. C8-1-8]|uniref:GNAT family N-acetyltransferase n=1 Tax=Clostridium sp. C8-1-8 TaxID=2698831 RepID=UPI00137142A4|nr:GNAT family N-acetyltransferase [Clostridium sp. C8-1-8]
MINKRLFKKFPCLYCGSFTLRELKINDSKELFEIYSDYENVNFITVNIHNTSEETKEMIKRLLYEYDNGISVYWVIAFNHSDKLIGFVAIHKIDYINSTARIAYILNKKYWGQGIAKKAIKKITELILEETQINRIEATIKPNNIPSLRCIKNAGYTLESKISGYVSDTEADSIRTRFLCVKTI